MSSGFSFQGPGGLPRKAFQLLWKSSIAKSFLRFFCLFPGLTSCASATSESCLVLFGFVPLLVAMSLKPCILLAAALPTRVFLKTREDPRRIRRLSKLQGLSKLWRFCGLFRLLQTFGLRVGLGGLRAEGSRFLQVSFATSGSLSGPWRDVQARVFFVGFRDVQRVLRYVPLFVGLVVLRGGRGEGELGL